MQWIIIFSYFLLLPIIFSVGLTIYSYRGKNIKKTSIFGFFMLTLCIISITSALEINSNTLQAKLFFRNLSQVGLLGAPIAFLLLSLDLSGKDKLINFKNIILISILPIITILLIYTNSYHHLMRSAVYINEALKPNSLVIKRTMLSSILLSFFNLITLVAMGNLAFSYRNIQKKYRIHILAALLCGVIPFSLNIIKNTLLAKNLSLFPVSLTTIPVGLIMFWCIFKYNVFDTKPIVRGKIMEEITDGILVVDNENRVVDVNNIALDMLNESIGLKENQIVGYNVNDILAHWENWLQSLSLSKEQEIEISYNINDTIKYYKVKITPMLNKREAVNGHLSVITDITKFKLYEDDLRIKATKDALTLINNRAHFTELTNSYLSNPKYKDLNVSLLAFDLDYFKKINDTYGHAVGDKALIHFSNICKNATRKYDILGRIGGEEFVATLPDTRISEALEIAERIRVTLENTPLILENEFKVSITVSIGAVSKINKETCLEQILAEADKALYKAKNNGRNRVEISS